MHPSYSKKTINKNYLIHMYICTPFEKGYIKHDSNFSILKVEKRVTHIEKFIL